MVNQVNNSSYTLLYTTLSPPLQVLPGQVISYGSLLPGLTSTINTPTVPPVDNLTRITVTGTLIADGGGYQTGHVSFRPILVNTSAHTVYAGAELLAAINGGAISIPLPATDDPNTAIPGFSYLVTEPSGAEYQILVPVASSGGTLDLSVAPRVGGAVTSVNGSTGAVTGLATTAYATSRAVALSIVLGG